MMTIHTRGTLGERPHFHPVVGHEPSTWLRDVLEDATRSIPAALRLIGIPVVIPITSARPGSREDRTCDRCRAFVPEGTPMFIFSFDHRGLVVTGGLCPECGALEFPEEVDR